MRAIAASTLRAVAAAACLAVALFALPPTHSSASAKCTITGTGKDDVLEGTRHADVICGRGGDDKIQGRGGADRLIGGAGADSLDGGQGGDKLLGGTGPDDLQGKNGADDLLGQPQADTLIGGAGKDDLDGGSGVDACDPGDGDDKLDGSCEDSTPPTLESFSISARSIDTSGGPADVTFSAEASDDLYGALDVEVDLTDPNPDISGRGITLQPHLEPDHLHWTYGTTQTFPRYSTAGSYDVKRITVTDNVGNQSVYDADELAADGYQTGFVQTGDGDLDPPELTSLSFSPQQLDSSAHDATFELAVGASDDLSGIDHIQVDFRPSDGSFAGPGGPLDLTSGDDNDGIWSGTQKLARYSRQGTYTLTEIFIADKAGHYAYYDTADLEAAGYPTSFQQIGADDHTPPVLSDLTMTPRKIDTSTGNDNVNMTGHLTDDLSGVTDLNGHFTILIEGPTGQQYDFEASRYAGTPTSGDWVAYPRLLRGSKLGTYTVLGVGLGDAVGNQVSLSTEDLDEQGFPTTFQNGP